MANEETGSEEEIRDIVARFIENPEDLLATGTRDDWRTFLQETIGVDNLGKGNADDFWMEVAAAAQNEIGARVDYSSKLGINQARYPAGSVNASGEKIGGQYMSFEVIQSNIATFKASLATAKQLGL